MCVAADDDVCFGENRTFQDSIVRFISQNMEMRLSLEDGGCFADGPYEVCDSFVGPSELGSELVGGLGEDRNGGE